MAFSCIIQVYLTVPYGTFVIRDIAAKDMCTDYCDTDYPSPNLSAIINCFFFKSRKQYFISLINY